MSEDASHTSGASTSGKSCHCVPKIVLFDVMCTKLAPSAYSMPSGMRSKFVSALDAATVGVPRICASLSAFFDHVPVTT